MTKLSGCSGQASLPQRFILRDLPQRPISYLIIILCINRIVKPLFGDIFSSMSNVKIIAKNIRKYKELRKTSFLKVAKKAGIPYTTLENILYQRVQDVQISTLQKIAKALGVKVDDLIK